MARWPLPELPLLEELAKIADMAISSGLACNEPFGADGVDNDAMLNTLADLNRFSNFQRPDGDRAAAPDDIYTIDDILHSVAKNRRFSKFVPIPKRPQRLLKNLFRSHHGQAHGPKKRVGTAWNW